MGVRLPPLPKVYRRGVQNGNASHWKCDSERNWVFESPPLRQSKWGIRISVSTGDCRSPWSGSTPLYPARFQGLCPVDIAPTKMV